LNRREPITRIRAVLVGIDRYERPDVPQLRGCVNDVALVRGLLKEFFAVPNEHLRVVVNSRATKANILHRLEATIAAAEPGDVVVFYFSGHGSQIRDRDGDELTDGLDEIICPYDMDWDRGTYIVDDELDDRFAGLPPGVLLEAFFDCCFWGADARGLEPEPRPELLRRDVRYLVPPFDIASRAEGDEDTLDIHRIRTSETFTERNVMWGASMEGQPAAEDYIDGRPNGIFTYWGCRFIAENIERVDRESYTREELLDDVRAYLHQLGYAQTPELSAPGELRASSPLLPDPEWGAWVEVGGPPVRDARRRGRARSPRR
jgi:metacaspase-1